MKNCHLQIKDAYFRLLTLEFYNQSNDVTHERIYGVFGVQPPLQLISCSYKILKMSYELRQKSQIPEIQT